MKENIIKVNSYYEGLIQNFYAGAKGCFSAFMHFFYQYNQSVVYGAEYSDCFKLLYETELENCKILSELLLMMGGDNIIELKSMIYKIENKVIKEKLKIILNNKKNSLKNLKENYFKNNLIN